LCGGGRKGVWGGKEQWELRAEKKSFGVEMGTRSWGGASAKGDGMRSN